MKFAGMFQQIICLRRANVQYAMFRETSVAILHTRSPHGQAYTFVFMNSMKMTTYTQF